MLRTRSTLPFGSLVLALVLVACGAPRSDAPTPDPPADPDAQAIHVLHRYVVLGSEGGEAVPYARVVLDDDAVDGGSDCPRIVGAASPIAMTPRFNPHGFEVVVCEARIGFGEELAVEHGGATFPLPMAKRDPQRVLVFGDTGCKLQKEGSSEGCAAGDPAEPFASLASAAAARPAADLLIHVGDYNYRGTGGQTPFTVERDGQPTEIEEWAYDAGDGLGADDHCGQADDSLFWSQNARNSNRPDSWANWRDDFFEPAGELLAQAPWVFARGNHELCSRAGPGYFYFLDPSTHLGDGQIQCPAAQVDSPPIDNVVLRAPYAVDLGNLSLLVLDASNACDAFTQEPFTGRYAEQLAELGELAPAEGTAWLVSHRPLWGVDGFEDGKSTGCTAQNDWSCLNQTLWSALDRGLDGRLPESVELLLAGHMHRFESLTATDASRPPVVVVGNSGVALESGPPRGEVGPLSVDGTPVHLLATADTVRVDGQTKAAFGFLEITRDGEGWSGVLHDPATSLTIAECGSERARAGAVCELAAGVVP